MPDRRDRFRHWASDNAHFFRVLLPALVLTALMLTAVHYIPHHMYIRSIADH
jgi:hypothetical protein